MDGLLFLTLLALLAAIGCIVAGARRWTHRRASVATALGVYGSLIVGALLLAIPLLVAFLLSTAH